MRRFARHLVPVLASLMLAASPASAGEILIDFEHLPGPDGKLNTADDTPMPAVFLQWVRDQFSPVGVSFTQGSLLQSAFFNGDPANHYLSSTNPIGIFTAPVTGISIESYSFWDAIMTAYDRDGKVLASHTLLNPNAGKQALRGVLSVTSATPIYGFSILPVVSQNHILNLDNMRLTVEVPEPGQLAVFGIGMLALSAAWRRRRSH